MLNVLPDPIFVKDRAHRWVIVNNAFCLFLGQPREWLYGKSDFDYAALIASVPARHEAEVFWKKDDEVFNSGEPNINFETHTDSEGRLRAIETKKTLLKDPQGSVYLIGVIRDLTELTLAKAQVEENNRELERKIQVRTQELEVTNAQLEHLAYFDPLTGLANRRLLLQTLNQLLAANPVAVFFLDLDHFKWVNVSQGHLFGDAVLIEVAKRLGALPQFDIVSRLGGDEFIAIATMLPLASEKEMATLAKSLLRALAEPVESVHPVPISASIGISVSPRDGITATELIQHADTALYHAKHRGRDQFVFFDAELGTRAAEHNVLETGLRAAIASHGLNFALQPIVDARTRQTLGFEALARWHDPHLGDISPDRFIRIAEYSGLIYDLGLTIMDQVLRLAPHYMHTHVRGTSARLAVNLSARQLARPSFLPDLKRLLESTAFPPENLEMEITETWATNLTVETRANLDGLHRMGVSIALDDFGTGFSSLKLLHRLPIDRIKIDQEFVAEIPGNQRTAALIEAMIRMSHALKLKVVAEGVEREDQAQFLAQLGCDELQGFLFGQPVLITRNSKD